MATQGKKVKTSTWNGMPLYQCPYCPYNSTISSRAVDEHIAGSHADQVRLDHLVKQNKKEAEAASGDTGPTTPTGDLPAGSAGANPTASATAASTASKQEDKK